MKFRFLYAASRHLVPSTQSGHWPHAQYRAANCRLPAAQLCKVGNGAFLCN